MLWPWLNIKALSNSSIYLTLRVTAHPAFRGIAPFLPLSRYHPIIHHTTTIRHETRSSLGSRIITITTTTITHKQQTGSQRGSKQGRAAPVPLLPRDCQGRDWRSSESLTWYPPSRTRQSSRLSILCARYTDSRPTMTAQTSGTTSRPRRRSSATRSLRARRIASWCVTLPLLLPLPLMQKLTWAP
jgi:hypothetical protein